ncbi:hypothetical protein, partial [Fulvimonas yonginensis]
SFMQKLFCCVSRCLFLCVRGSCPPPCACAHAGLLQRALACTLDLRPRIAPREPALERLCADVRAVTGALGFEFG